MSDLNIIDVAPIEIRPEVTILSVLRHLNYKAWFAIAEFIDNAIQSSITNYEALHKNDETYKLVVDIRLNTTKPGSLVITDNAAGISLKDFPRAFKAAQVPDMKGGLSEFGMGMKSAACWFAEKWSVRTKALNETDERLISFDVQNIINNKIEHIEVESRRVKISSHYTVVNLQNLHHLPQGRTVGKIKDHLTSIYRVFLRNQDIVIRFNGEPLVYTSPLILKSKKYSAPGQVFDIAGPEIEWKKDINLDFGAGQRVSGFVALRKIGSTPLAGFALFRRNRLIVGSHDETYRPSFIFKNTNSYPYQRLFGELHIEGFEVSHTKDGFRWEEYEDIFLELLKNEISSEPLDLLSQAENYRALPTKNTIEQNAIKATHIVAGYIESTVAPIIIEARQQPASPAPLPLELESSPLQASERTVSVDDGDWSWLITLRTSIDPAVNDWVSLSKMENGNEDSSRLRRISLDVSLAHPFSSEFLGPNNENIELFLRIATAVCISLVLSEDLTSEPPQVVLCHLNSLLRGALRRKEI